jgi:hypothetical protein
MIRFWYALNAACRSAFCVAVQDASRSAGVPAGYRIITPTACATSEKVELAGLEPATSWVR